MMDRSNNPSHPKWTLNWEIKTELHQVRWGIIIFLGGSLGLGKPNIVREDKKTHIIFGFMVSINMLL